jgi:hypothetical protein
MRNDWWRALTAELAPVVQEMMQPERVSVWLKETR